MTLARILGLIAGVLAWTAALIGYLDNHRVNFALIAAGVFFGRKNAFQVPAAKLVTPCS